MQRNRDAVGIFGISPAELCRKLDFFALCHFRQKAFGMNQILVCLQNRLCNADIRIIRVFDFESEATSVAELIERKSFEPIGIVFIENITEFLYHRGLVICAGYIAVSIEF